MSRYCQHKEEDQADRVGANGVVYVCCLKCSEVLTRAPDEHQLSPAAQEQLRRFGGGQR